LSFHFEVDFKNSPTLETEVVSNGKSNRIQNSYRERLKIYTGQKNSEQLITKVQNELSMCFLLSYANL